MRIHFIGSQGVSMSWLASYFRSRGDEVSGSDITTGGHSAENVLGADLVVYTAAITADNVELAAAKKEGIMVIPRAELLGEVSRGFETVIAVGGTHGKTTVTGMLGCVIPDAALHIGGSIGGRQGRTEGHTLICEACEYKESFLHLKRDIAVVLNAEHDHPDYYPDYDSVITAFGRFTGEADVLVTTPQLAAVLPVRERTVTVGDSGDCYVISFQPGKRIELSVWGRRISFVTPLIGRHNAGNLAFSAAVAALSGVSDEDIAFRLSRFGGVDRRLQKVGSIDSAVIISDYAHHPDEIIASVSAVKSSGMKKVLAVFQPHTYSRLNTLFGGFIKGLRRCDSIILPVFAAREPQNDKCDGRTLCGSLKAAGAASVYAPSFEAAAELIKRRAKDYDAVMIMGAGDVTALVGMLNLKK